MNNRNSDLSCEPSWISKGVKYSLSHTKEPEVEFLQQNTWHTKAFLKMHLNSIIHIMIYVDFHRKGNNVSWDGKTILQLTKTML